MKVVLFKRRHRPGAYSIERLFDDICKAMPKDIEVEICVSKYSSKGLWRRLFNIISAARNQGDINHITGDVHFLTYLMKRRKTILTIHDCVTLERLKGIRYWIFWFFWYWLPAKRSAIITVISESTKKELQNHLRSNQYRIEVIPDCVSERFRPFTKAFNEECPRILQIGTKKNKNVERVAEALEGLPCSLMIIGKLSTDQMAALQRYGINFESQIGVSYDEMVAQYQQADMVIFASLYEGFGLPIPESNAVGRPVITSRLYSMPEVGGDAACYVDPYDVADIRAAVLKIIGDSKYRDQLVENGFKNITRFRPDFIAIQYADLYRRVFKGLV